jgi:hypothetical protein
VEWWSWDERAVEAGKIIAKKVGGSAVMVIMPVKPRYLQTATRTHGTNPGMLDPAAKSCTGSDEFVPIFPRMVYRRNRLLGLEGG